MKRTLLAGALALVCFVSPVWGQTYFDTGGTRVDGYVPLAGCTAGGHCTGPVGPSAPLPVISQPYTFTALGGGQSNQAATTATTLTIPTGALYARICAVGSQMNFVDSTNGTPTTGASPTVGTPLYAGSCILEQGPTVLAAFSLINAVPSTGAWTAVYFK